MKKRDIWEIITFGTSFTKGGGFEFWANPKLKEFYNDIDEPKLQFNFSWPGQLQKLILKDGKKAKVINHAKSGYGHELLIRKAWEIILENIDDLDSRLFLFEFGGLGRKEYWHNVLGWVISNYHFEQDGVDFTHIPEEFKPHWTVTHGLAQTYFEDNDSIKEKLKEDFNLFDKFNKTTISFGIELEKMSRDIISFLSFCDSLDVNYIVTSAPFLEFRYQELNTWKEKQVIYERDGSVNLDMYGFLAEHRLRIKDETNGKIDDGHGGYKGNQIIAENIYKKIKSNYYLPKNKHED